MAYRVNDKQDLQGIMTLSNDPLVKYQVLGKCRISKKG